MNFILPKTVARFGRYFLLSGCVSESRSRLQYDGVSVRLEPAVRRGLNAAVQRRCFSLRTRRTFYYWNGCFCARSLRKTAAEDQHHYNSFVLHINVLYYDFTDPERAGI